MSAGFRLDVSRETHQHLLRYADLLRKWTKRINLVARSTEDNLWRRHIIDSAQVLQLAPHHVGHWVDLGSGAGFPGLIIAIMALETGTPKHVTLVESDARKSAFLRTVIRETGVAASVVTARIEDCAPLEADILSARALADLTTLLAYTERHLAADGTALFHKGIAWQKELQEAKAKWNFRHEVARSITEDGPVLLSITGVSRA